MSIILANNAKSLLVAAIGPTDTTLTVTSGTETLFPSPTAGDYFYVTLEDSTKTVREIVKCTSRSGVTFTIVRGQDDTLGNIFAIGSTVEMRVNKATLNDTVSLAVAAAASATSSASSATSSATSAGTSATNAAASATAAASSASSASTSATSATSSASSASTSATNASASATSASGSASTATTQAGIATTQATSATSSASAASTSATNASNSATSAGTSASNASTSASSASTSASSASTSASTATTQAGIATTQATNASNSASSAASSASAAAASAASGMYSAVQDKSANYTVVAGDAGDLIRVTTTSGAVTITLPLISTQVDGFKVSIVKWTGDSNAVNIARSGSDTINGATSATIGSQYSQTTFVADFETNQWFAASSGLGSSNVAVDAFSGNNSTVAFTLSGDPGSENNTQVYVSGVYQEKDTYSVSGATLTFSAAPPTGTSNIEVVWTAPLAIGTPSDGTVTTAKIVDANVTLAKLSASGTPSASTYLRGDNSWAAIASSQWTTSGSNIYYTAGSVGIGTTSPNAPLEVFKTSNKTAIFGNATANNGNYITLAGASTTKNWVISNNMIVGAEFGIGRTSATGGTDIGATHDLMIDTSGNTLFNSGARTSARALVDIPTTGGSAGVTLAISRGGDGGTMVNFYSMSSTTTIIGSIGNSSNTNTTYNTSSDYRLKENIAPMTGALNAVSALKPITWKWKSNGEDGQGFLAHELAEVVPDCVTGAKDAVDDDGNPIYQGIDTSYLVATLTAAIQELKAINDTQAETLSQQATLINALTARITALENK